MLVVPCGDEDAVKPADNRWYRQGRFEREKAAWEAQRERERPDPLIYQDAATEIRLVQLIIPLED